MNYIIVIFVAMLATATSASEIQVPITFVEALDSKDTTSSERFRKEYERAIQYGIELNREDLEVCGYKLKTSTEFYGASDPLQAKERTEDANKKGSWFIVGPRRSNHYMLAARGSGPVPTISLMASSDEVSLLGPEHISLVATNSEMAKEAAKEAAYRLKSKNRKSYIAVVRDDCLYCKGFAEQFDKSATKVGLKKVDEILIYTDEPELKSIFSSIEKNRPDFVFLPNYSIVSGYLIASIHEKHKNVFFVGGDGWGSKFGFVENGREISSAGGFTVRGNPPVEVGLSSFNTGRRVLQDTNRSPVSSASALSLLKIIDSMRSFLCEQKPKSKVAFAKLFRIKGASYFKSPWGVSIYDLSGGNIVYKKSSRAM